MAVPRETVGLSAPSLLSQAANAMKVLTRFAVWGLDVGYDLDRERVLTPEELERYRAAGLRELAATSRATELSRLRALARVVTRRAPWPAPEDRGSRQQLSPPYTDAEIDEYWEAASAQSGPFRVQAMRAVLVLSVGVGARARELFAVTGRTSSMSTGSLRCASDRPGRRGSFRSAPSGSSDCSRSPTVRGGGR
ncbi:hypothetical protein [Rhodococcus indonesiensis]